MARKGTSNLPPRASRRLLRVWDQIFRHFQRPIFASDYHIDNLGSVFYRCVSRSTTLLAGQVEGLHCGKSKSSFNDHVVFNFSHFEPSINVIIHDQSYM